MLTRKAFVAFFGVGSFLFALPVYGAIVNQIPSDSQYFRVYQACPPTFTVGGTTLSNEGRCLSETAGANIITDAIHWQYGTTTIHHGSQPDTTNASRPSWSATWGQPLAGTLSIYYEMAFDKDIATGECYHGEQFSAMFRPDPATPIPAGTHIGWVQIVRNSLPWEGLASGFAHVDPYPNAGADDSPLYFSNGRDPDDFAFWDGRPTAVPGDLYFGDTSLMHHGDRTLVNGWFEAHLFLVSWTDANIRSLTIRDGITWGYRYECIPEPGVLALLAIGGVSAARRRRGVR